MTVLHEPTIREKLVEVKTIIIHKPSDIFIVFVDLWIGLALVASDPNRESSAAYTVAKEVMPMRAWGALFITLGIVVLAALWCRRTHKFWTFERLADVSRLAGPALYSFWAITFFLAAVTQTTASFVAVGAYMYLAYRHSFCPVPGKS